MAKRTKPRAEFSTLEVAVCMQGSYIIFETKLPKLKLKTLPKQLLGSLPLDIWLPIKEHKRRCFVKNITNVNAPLRLKLEMQSFK